MVPLNRKLSHRPATGRAPTPGRPLCLGILTFWLCCTPQVHSQSLGPAAVDPDVFKQFYRPPLEFRPTPWRELEAMDEEARVKSLLALTAHQLLIEQEKRLELSTHFGGGISVASPLPMNTVNPIWEVPIENPSGRSSSIILGVGIGLAGLLGAWKISWLRRAVKVPVQ